MLFLGVEISNMTCNISAVSSSFTFLSCNYFGLNNCEKIEEWIRSLILSNNEEIKWFFCEKHYRSHDYTSSPFYPSVGYHTHYIVKDRIALDFYHLICDIERAYNRSLVDLSLILAMSLKLFDLKYIKLYSDPEQLYLWA